MQRRMSALSLAAMVAAISSASFGGDVSRTERSLSKFDSARGYQRGRGVNTSREEARRMKQAARAAEKAAKEA